MDVRTITRAEYNAKRRHDYAGTKTTLFAETAQQ